LFGLVDLEIVGVQHERQAAPLPAQRVAQRALQVEMERVAVFVGLRLVGAFVAGPDALDAVLAEGVSLETPEQVAQGLAADAAQAARGELEATFFLVDEACLAERFGEPRQPVERVGGDVAQQAAYRVEVDFLQGVGGRRVAEEVFEGVEVIEFLDAL